VGQHCVHWDAPTIPLGSLCTMMYPHTNPQSRHLAQLFSPIPGFIFLHYISYKRQYGSACVLARCELQSCGFLVTLWPTCVVLSRYIISPVAGRMIDKDSTGCPFAGNLLRIDLHQPNLGLNPNFLRLFAPPRCPKIEFRYITGCNKLVCPRQEIHSKNYSENILIYKIPGWVFDWLPLRGGPTRRPVGGEWQDLNLQSILGGARVVFPRPGSTWLWEA